MPNSSPFDLFVQRAHELLQAGYAAMDAKAWNPNQEPEISGELTAQIRSLVDDAERRQPWMRYWTPINDEPEDESGKPKEKRRLGNRRKRPDIKLKFAGQRGTQYFRFEAKKLQSSGDFSDLISHEDGLGRFLRRVYGRQDAAGGLLAYVKTETLEIHAGRVRDAFERQPKKYRIAKGGEWCAVQWKSGPICCFRTEHVRAQAGGRIAIYCTFLLFC